ncbi:AraC family transcriptional regulator [Nocardia mexicana]|uniref:AraC family transcriptional regulator n=1 Tax=Nocardia mexicana TaxID=279262 RepID=A0A370GSQ2_9NOCA|nr:AraC family transcriptional regulator [Nocardia mexicana]RDI46727.1 AraC family transcriptional regulator [Nocardia mexicana]
MITTDQLRPPASAALLVRVGGDHGVPTEVCLTRTGITADQLDDPDYAVPAGAELQIVRNLQAALPDVDALGLEAGRRYHVTTHGVWGFALASCRDGWEALELGVRFLGLTWAFCDISPHVDNDTVRMIFDDHAVPDDVRAFLVQREIASVVTVAREVGGLPTAPAAIHLRQPAPASVTPFTEFLGAPPVFDADVNYLEIPAALLDAPLPQADTHTAALTRTQCHDLLEHWRARTGYTGTVRQILVRTPGHMPGIEEVADQLHLSSRTLRRRLGEEGITFRHLVDDVRRALADELLTSGNLSIHQIAHRLGYNATSAFTAAFTRWHGTPPSAYRHPESL